MLSSVDSCVPTSCTDLVTKTCGTDLEVHPCIKNTIPLPKISTRDY